MAQFQSFEPHVEVNGQTILSVVDGMSPANQVAYKILKKNGIESPQPGEWYPQQAWLDAFREIAETIGSQTLYLIGQRIPENADFPPNIDTLEKALASIDIAYHMNHRGGEIGYYRLETLDETHFKMICKNPYPSDFDRGILYAMARRFTDPQYHIEVLHDESQTSRKNGDDTCIYFINVTHQREATRHGVTEDELNRTILMLRSALESTADGIYVADRQGNLVSVNQRFHELWEVPESIQRAASDQILYNFLLDSLKDPAQFKNLIATMAGTPENESFDVLELKNGRIFERYSRPQRIYGRNIGRVWSFRDVTRQVVAERSLQETLTDMEQRILERTAELRVTNETLEEARAQAEEANRAKSAFLANMSHELRTPMNAIIGFSQVMQRDSDLTLRQSEHLEIILQSGEHLLNLINNILEMSKIEAGQSHLNTSSFDFHQMMAMLRDTFLLPAQNKGLQLMIEYGNTPQYVAGDESKIRQILINLLGNALKFTQEGGIGVRVHYDDDQETLHFEVEDTGAGIAPDELDRLFQPFAQTSTGIQSMQGTGLGLAITRQFIMLMHGDINVKSMPGEGTLFQFYIQAPLADGITTTAQAANQPIIGIHPDSPCQDCRILVVDDKWENRRLVSEWMAAAHIEVREAADGQEAVEIWQNWQPHLIWMDMRMPVMDGYEATRQIKATAQGQETVVIALTASAFEHERATTLAAGCDDFVSKPVRRDTIFGKMSQHLGIQYLYADENNSAASASDEVSLRRLVQSLPDEQRSQLEIAASNFDVEHALAVIDTITLPELQSQLRQIMKAYRFDTLQNLLMKTEVSQ